MFVGPTPGTRTLAVRGPFRGPTGHDHHVREFVRSLAGFGVRVQLMDVPEWSAARLPAHLADPWFGTLEAPVPADVAVHFCMPPQVTETGHRLAINYTMFEATRVPAAWVAHGRRQAAVIVPTQSSVAAWSASGFPVSRLRVCPLGVDPRLFHPGVAPLDLVDRRGRRVAEYGTRVLNVSEVSPRKNLVALVRAWLRATHVDDDAVLILKLGRSQPGRTLRLLRDIDAMEGSLGRTRRDAASILFYDEVLGDRQMPALFAAATHYWSMSHGEGWDQPMVEAAASGLRLIAPAHSAYLAYLDPSVARLIPARQVPARVDGDDWLASLVSGADWWEPNEEAAVEVIRDAIAGRDGGETSARARIAETLTWDRAAARLLEIVDEIEAAGWT
jgi:glycosyltransferase involved in cell wall biosynthesis